MSHSAYTRLQRLAFAILALAFASFAGLSAQAALKAVRAHQVLDIAVPPAKGFEAEEHFPGAALLYVDQPAAAPVTTAQAPAPATGTTGTTALPALPLPVDAAQAIAADAGVAGVIAARPFSMARASAADRTRAAQCLTTAIYYEAASEPDAGQEAVGQVILNRVRHPAFPASVCGVVYQGSEHAGCQFSFACDGSMARIPARAAWTRAARAAGMALAGYVYAPVGLATHYHTYAVTPAWNRSLVMTAAVGAHFFHRWKGYWGTAAAFRQSYAGGEPLPGPHAPVLAPPVAPLGVPILASAARVPMTSAATIQPAYAHSGAAIAPPPAADDMLPPASQVLDRWKDSGKPLR